MPETITPIPTEAQEHYASLINDGARPVYSPGNVLHLEVTDKQRDEAAAEMEAALATPAVKAEVDIDTVPITPETVIGREELRGLLRESAVGAYGWFDGQEIPSDRKGGASWFQYMRLGNVEWARGAVGKNHTPVKLHDEFATAGIPELVTIDIAPEGVKLGKVKPDSANADEQLAVISYETANDSDGAGRSLASLKYGPGSGHNATPFRLDVYLGKEDAERIMKAGKQNPGVIRSMLDEAMRQELGADGSWDGDTGVKPDYEEWKEVNGGVNRMAFRAGYDSPVADSVIREF